MVDTISHRELPVTYVILSRSEGLGMNLQLSSVAVAACTLPRSYLQSYYARELLIIGRRRYAFVGAANYRYTKNPKIGGDPHYLVEACFPCLYLAAPRDTSWTCSWRAGRRQRL